ncbi:hypothetical protein JCM8547_000477 [Rhodosporidiobolus lusitaniae]
MNPQLALLEKWTAEQLEQASLACFRDSFASFSVQASPAFALPPLHPLTPPVYREEIGAAKFPGLETVGGLDISFGPGDEAVAVLAVLSFPELKLLNTLAHRIDLSATPYIHSYLSFREADHYLDLIKELRSQPDARIPQVLLVDGNGRWHPRQAGSAVAVGAKTGIPTIGIAKEYHTIASTSTSPPPPSASSTLLPSSSSPLPPFPPDFRSSQKGMRNACQVLLKRTGEWMGLTGPSKEGVEDEGEREDQGEGEVDERYWGAAVLTSPSKTASNPVFVSPGHLLSLSTAIQLTLACCTESKVPEPVRKADAIGREEVRKLWGVSATATE